MWLVIMVLDNAVIEGTVALAGWKPNQINLRSFPTS